MKRLFRKFKEKISFKELPPPYRESDDSGARQREFNEQVPVPVYEALDLLANCKISSPTDENQESDVEYAEIRDMGLWHSTPLARRHKSKISLTWVLKENLENAKLPIEKSQNEDKRIKIVTSNVDRHQRHNQKFNENERYRKCKYREVKERVVGRNEYYHNLKFRSTCDEFVNSHDTYSDDTSVATEEHTRRKHRHRHRRKKKNGKFGYDIRDLDSFLSEASLDRPGNIPVVVAYPTTLYQTTRDSQRELTLPLGTVVNAVFKSQQWLYVQTPHAQEGYVMYNACLPLGILPSKTPQKKTPCWESSTDIYPRPCGNLTDTEKEQLRGRTRSECQYRTKKRTKNCAERDFDSLYLKTKSVSHIDTLQKEFTVKRHTLMVVNSDFKGSVLNKTLTVRKGDVVVLQGTGAETAVDADWFYVKKNDGSKGFIPAAIAGHGYI